jgi:dTDP-4-dehydrorhamnose 3,5-epimerase
VIFTETALEGAFVVALDRKEDDRGFFARAFCEREFDEHGIASTVRQANISLSHRAGTVRGMHFQYPPAAENKFIRCISGAILDVIIDLRPESSTFLHHTSVELSAANRLAFVVPPRFAHGFMSLTDDAEVLYLVSEFYTPAEEGGLRWDDPDLGIEWPRGVSVITDKDAGWPSIGDQRASIEQKMRLGGQGS